MPPSRFQAECVLRLSLFRAYHQCTVKRLALPVLLSLIFCGTAAAQLTTSARVNARGQVYAPSGAAMQVNVRIQLSGEDGQRPPEILDTDSKGAFVIYNLTQGASYTLIVDSDGKNWATTIEHFYALGPRPFVTIHLRPPENATAVGAAVSVAELNQNVPRAARREYESGVQQVVAGNLEGARKSFQHAIELFPEFVEARSELAAVLMHDGDLSGAEALLRRALEIEGPAVRPTLNLGLCLSRQQRYAAALPFLERGVQLQPVNPKGNLVYGITLAMTGDDDRAEPVLRKAYEQGGKPFTKAQLHLARLYARQKKYDRAAEALETYLRDLPDAPSADDLRVTLAKLRAASRP